MTIMAELHDVWKSYGSGESRVLALRGITLQLPAGQLILVEGPSGGGKTTMLEILGLLAVPDQGRVLLAGEDFTTCSEGRRTLGRREHVAFIFQDFNLLSSLSARDNIGVVADMHRPDGAAATKKILRQVGLESRQSHIPAAMSGGQKQRVSIGRAMASLGRLVLADEPTANLDWTVGEPIVRVLKDMAHREGRCVVIVSHDARLEPHADQVVRLVDGRIEGVRALQATVASGISLAPTPPMVGTAAAAIPTPSTMTTPPTPTASAATEAQAPIVAAASPPPPPLPPRAQPQPRPRRYGRWFIAAALVVLALVAVWQFRHRPGLTQTSQATPPEATGALVLEAQGVIAAAPAVVEPASKLVQISSDRPGIIRHIDVTPGQDVQPGQPLFRLNDEEAKAQVELCEANVAVAQARLNDLQAGTRPEKREESQANLQAAQALLVKNQFDYDRVKNLYATGSANLGEMNNAQALLDQAKAEVRRAQAVLALAEAGPTLTQVREAQAQVAQAQSQLDAARASLDLRTIRSPIAGKVLYIYRGEGDVIYFPTPAPVISLGAAGNLRLRAEVDETDICHVHVGQDVVAVSDSYPDRKFTGKVVSMENLMGHRNIHTDRPRERQDVRVREIVIELNSDARDLPIDLLMTAQFLLDGTATSQP